MAMLLVESENAKILRQIMLDIVIDFVNQRTGGSTKYISQRDQDFISAFLQEENYRREFTDALRIMLIWEIVNMLFIQTKFIKVFSKKSHQI